MIYITLNVVAHALAFENLMTAEVGRPMATLVPSE